MVKKINLALQGGGAHGAFTWGVLDRLLEDKTIEIAGISGTSAGALNGAALKAGLVQGGREGARENLDWLWKRVGALSDGPISDWIEAVSPNTELLSRTIENSLPFTFVDAASRIVSPYHYGPFYKNPLEKITRRLHFDAICGDQGPALYVCATNVRTGKIKVFSGDEISTDALLASACLPCFRQLKSMVKPIGMAVTVETRPCSRCLTLNCRTT